MSFIPNSAVISYYFSWTKFITYAYNLSILCLYTLTNYKENSSIIFLIGWSICCIISYWSSHHAMDPYYDVALLLLNFFIPSLIWLLISFMFALSLWSSISCRKLTWVLDLKLTSAQGVFLTLFFVFSVKLLYVCGVSTPDLLARFHCLSVYMIYDYII